MIQIKKGEIYIDGEKTIDATLVGLALQDIAENRKYQKGKLIINKLPNEKYKTQ